MRFRRIPALSILALAACAAQAGAQEQKQDRQVIEEFVNTRGPSTERPGEKPQKRAGKATPPRRNGKAAGKGAGGTGAARAVALGYTILLKDEAGQLSVVDPSREFKTGDNIAVALESNADGYLYMFNAPDGRNPEMLFPSVLLDGGANMLPAHARATFPADPSLDFRFTDPPAREHLFVVLSREPLAGVPTGEALAEFCGENRDDCSWKPPAQLWERITSAARGRGITEAKSVQPAQAPTRPVTRATLRRGLKVRREDPKPAVVRVNDSPGADLLVTEIVLTHR